MTREIETILNTWTHHKLKDAKTCHRVANCQLCNCGSKSPHSQRLGLKHTHASDISKQPQTTLTVLGCF